MYHYYNSTVINARQRSWGTCGWVALRREHHHTYNTHMYVCVRARTQLSTDFTAIDLYVNAEGERRDALGTADEWDSRPPTL